MKRKIIVALALAGTIGIGTAYAAGMWPDYPIVGGATYCAGTSSTATGTLIGAVTGCPNQVPAGPTVLTGLEQIPADTKAAGGAAPQTVLVPMASLNALPVTIQAAAISGANTYVAPATSGGVVWTAASIISGSTVTLPATPIQGQQFVVSANRTISTLIVTANNNVAGNTTPTVLTASLVAAYGYRFIYDGGSSLWYRLQ